MPPVHPQSYPQKDELSDTKTISVGNPVDKKHHSILKVATPGPFQTLLDYKTDQNASTLIGKRVAIPLGNRKVTGLAVSSSEKSDFAPQKLKSILSVIDDSPLFNCVLLELICWVSQYYHHPIGDTFHTAMLGALSGGAELKPETVTFWECTTHGKHYDLSKLNRAAKQKSALAYLQQDQADVTTLVSLGICQTILKSLEKKALIRKVEKVLLPSNSAQKTHAKTLNPEQEKVLNQALSKGDSFSIQLLEGITGSGKTEIYLQRIEPILDTGKQVLILVPEIGLTPQTISRFEGRFPVPVIALHSHLNDTKRKAAIYHAKSGDAKIIIGTRSATFIPTFNLGMIIIDEEHDLSFKQQSGLRYHARDVAIKRAQIENIPIMLGSATPSLESLYHAISGKYHFFRLTQRAAQASLPQFHVISLKQQKLNGGLSKPLIKAIKTHLDHNGQVLIFINRKGFAPILMCHDCHWIYQCPRCEKPYTIHTHPTRLICHHCNSSKPIIDKCPECNSENPLGDVGTGTEKIEMTLNDIFPHHNIIRIDRSSVSKKNELAHKLTEIHSGKADILVGTQMIAKGHHFRDLTMVGIVNIDDSLFSNDFRATEYLGQLITQVAGRAGRAQKQGEVYLQTAHLEHPLLNLLLKNGYHAYARTLLQERQSSHFPPFSYIATIRSEAHDLTDSFNALSKCKQILDSSLHISVDCFGPLPSFLAKRAGFFRAQLMLHADSRKSVFQALRQIQFELLKTPLKKVRLSFDVDPKEMD